MSEGNYIIFYQLVKSDEIEVKRVIHSKRNLHKALLE
ncbi:MAG: hypothetical protein K2X77_15985 [Candidatus Obscuribacterales bacterium]|nr:hypothetical protein [Candidatus Obscuribacterales bacterium]